MNIKSLNVTKSIAEFYESAVLIIKERKIFWFILFGLKILRPYKYVTKLLKKSELSKKEIEKLIDAAFECVVVEMSITTSGVQKIVSISDINNINRIHAIVNILYWIRAESKSSHAINLLCTNEINRIKEQIQIYGSVEQFSVSAHQHYLIENLIEDYQPYAEFDLSREEVNLLDPYLESESIQVLMGGNDSDFSIINGNLTVH
jgi:hypothetical protein